MNKNILMICYYFPPLADVGCKRSVAFSTYLAKYGWTPSVLSVKNPDKTYCNISNEKLPAGLLTEYSYSIINPYKMLGKVFGATSKLLALAGIKIKRNYLYDVFCIPDIFMGWIPLTFIKGLGMIRRYHIDTIYVSSPPFSGAAIGALLKKATGCKLIIDYRDPYGLDMLSGLGLPRSRLKINQAIEKKVLHNADIVIVSTGELKEMFINQYPQITDRIFMVHNGFEPSHIGSGNVDKYKKFTIVYAGDFYFYAPQMQVFTDMLFGGLALLKKKGIIHDHNFQFIFYGTGRIDIEDIARKHGLTGLVFSFPRIRSEEMIKVLSSSHLELLRIVKPMISTKLFEGISLNIPLLATIPCGEVENIIRTYSPSSYILDENSSAEAVADTIKGAMERHSTNQVPDNNVEAFLRNFSREELTLRFIKILESEL
jgi:glycosyltransferase involved in cell wall biosynthesis